MQPIALPVMCRLLEGEAGDRVTITILAPETSVHADDGSQHSLSLEARVDFSLSNGCIEQAQQSTVQRSPDGSRVDNSMTWERTETLRIEEE